MEQSFNRKGKGNRAFKNKKQKLRESLRVVVVGVVRNEGARERVWSESESEEVERDNRRRDKEAQFRWIPKLPTL